ncbi:hypothetical protein [Streptomyces sp. Da 82-17]|uniref:hypothetical protein n=1 Tax=Streptomyces sp. Da 82-17 TaxID=3377116 RepID=UPI0038D3CD3E
MDFAFVCGWCDSDVTVWGEPVASWWTDKYELPDEWECFYCEGVNVTPPPPWTPAD